MKGSSPAGSALSDECLAHFQKGSIVAYISIVCHYSEPLGSFVSRLTGDANVAAEIVQDSFNKLWLRHAVIGNADSIEAFLYTSARHSCFMHLDKGSKHGSIFQR